MDRDTELQRLEQFVEKLLLNFSELKEQKKNLLSKLKDRDNTILEMESNIADLEGNIGELEGDISSKDSERTEISLRVNKLVEQIEDWELGLDEKVAEEEDIVDAAEEEGRVQQDLFSTTGSSD